MTEEMDTLESTPSASLDSVCDDRANTVHYRYPVETISDLTLRMRVSNTSYEFFVHKQTMATACGYFNALISDPIEQRKRPLIVDLPAPTPWSVTQLRVFIGCCYGDQHWDRLSALSAAPTVKEFVALMYQTGSQLNYTAAHSGSAGNPWTVTAHTDEGKIHLTSGDAMKQVKTLQSYTLTLLPKCWRVSEASLLRIELHSQVTIAQYFQQDRLLDALSNVLFKLADIGSIHLMCEIATKCQSLPRLHAACMDKLRGHKWQAGDRDRVLKLPHQVVVDLLLPASK